MPTTESAGTGGGADDALEGGVVGGAVDGRRAEAPYRVEWVAACLVLDVGIAQAHREVGRPLPGGDDAAPSKPFERHVPEPRRVAPVGHARIDGDHDRQRGRPQEVEGLDPAGGVLGKEETGERRADT